MFKYSRFFIAQSLLAAFIAFPAQAQETPPGPLVEISPARGEIVLNGTWKFAAGSLGEAPANMPAFIRVPGSWSAPANSWIASGVEAPKLESAIYSRSIEIPASWAGRRILLQIGRVSTEAEVSINGKSLGKVEWPYGSVDLTSAVQPGQSAQLQITVQAKTPEGEVWALMGYATEERKKRQLASRGLIGDVVLTSQPNGTRVEDVFVKPSVRQKKLDVEVELSGAPPGMWEFRARLLDEKGVEEIVLTTKAQVANDPNGIVTLSFPWEKPRLWDLEQPHLYTLLLEAIPPGATKPVDVYAQRFGFREIWIEGRNFILNGIPIRWRPAGGHEYFAHRVEIDANIDGLRAAGFNISQIWPEDGLEPGHANFWDAHVRRASEKGWAIMAAAPSLKEVARAPDGKAVPWLADAKIREAWIKSMRAELRRFRNEPSIMMWGTSGNLNNHLADQNPLYLGQQAKLNAIPQWEEVEKVAKEGLAAMKAVDSTRPYFVHAGSRLGDVFTVNHYLNLIPLQEREEWFSEYVRTGDVPYMAVEFGVPFNTNMNRGRTGFGIAHKSEPLMTEHCAAYLGARAYEVEPRDYRRNVRFGYSGQDWTGDWTQVQWLQSSPATFQELQALFIRATHRAWRTAGVTGGMIPWNMTNQIFLNRDRAPKVDAPAFTPGQRGPQPAQLSKANVHYLQPEGGWVEREAAKVYRETNQATLAWIAGPADLTP